ncbi:MAG: hypothetical protein DRJ61_02050 [Acidobacteria bacterium]|nr:MAG: hypothetical protein DRJ61_02050 [Acidobacteriota bacterium]
MFTSGWWETPGIIAFPRRVFPLNSRQKRAEARYEQALDIYRISSSGLFCIFGFELDRAVRILILRS